jgi:hypothetical protein
MAGPRRRKKQQQPAAKAKKGTDAGSEVNAAIKKPVTKFQKAERTSKTKKK